MTSCPFICDWGATWW